MEKNKVLALIFITTLLGSIVMVTNSVNSQTSEYPDNYLVTQLIKTDPIPLQTSEYADIWIKVSNRGNNKLENVEIRYDPQYPFSVDPDEKTEWNLGTMHPLEEYRIHLQIKVDENAIHGKNQLRIYTEHKNTDEDLRKIPIEIRTDDAALSTEKIEFPNTVRPGTKNQMNLTLRNLADSDLKNIEAYIDPSSKDLPIGITNNRRRIQKIESETAKQITYTIKTDQNAENGVYKIPVKLKYENEAGVNFEVQQMTEVTIGGNPNLKLNLKNKILKPNQKNQLNLEIINNGQGKANYVSIKIRQNKNYQILTNNLKYMEKIDPGNKETFNTTIFIEKTGKELTIPIEITQNNPQTGLTTKTQELQPNIYTEQELKEIRLTNLPELEIDLTKTELREPGKTGNITLRTINKGEGQAKYVTLQIPESPNYKILSTNNTYYGNLKPENHQTTELEIYAEQNKNNITIPAKLTYKTETGETKTTTQKITLELLTEEQIKKYNIKNGDINTIIIIGTIIIAFIAIIAAIPIINKYIK